MRANVLNDLALVKRAGQFVWLSVDSDRPENAAFLDKYPVDAWPSFRIIDPQAEKIRLDWYGTATAAQLSKLLDDGLAALHGSGQGVAALLARADGLAAEKKHAEAAAGYREALDKGGANWPRRARATESLVMELMFANDQKSCTQAAIRFAPAMARDRSFVNTVSTGAQCVEAADAKADWRPAAQAALTPLALEGVALKNVLADDRSGLYQVTVGLLKGDAAKKLAFEWWDFLEQQGKTAPNAEARSSLDSQRVAAAFALGDPARAIPALQSSERDLPKDYNPPLRLANVYEKLGRHDDALAACDRALGKAYGPRKIGLYLQRVNILEKKGDKPAARRTVEDGIKFAATLPPGRSVDSLLGALKQHLSKL